MMYSYLNWKKKAVIMAGRRWFLPYGIPRESCIAAYRFKGATSISESQFDWAEHGYNLSYSNVDFDPAYGLRSGTITQTALANLSNVVTQVVSYSNFAYDGYGTGDGRFLLTNLKFNTNGIPALSLYMKFPAKDHGGDTEEYTVNDGHWGAVLSATHTSEASGERNDNVFLTTNEFAPSSGIVAVDKNNRTLWRNGSNIAASVQTATFWDGYPSFLDRESTNPVNTAYRSPYRGGGTAYIKAAVFFSCSLSPEQHAELVRRINEL